LKREGYIADFSETDETVGKTLTLNLKYGPSRERSIAGLRRVSKPGLRVYAKSTALPRVLGGLGIAILSTSGGLLTDRQAQKKGVGGEVLAYVW
jgi:small subunit ribosomal protein S8